MRIARPSILWRLLSVELWRLLAITSAVLVCIIAFATTIKPFADGRLGALDALRFMGYAIIPMLQYALPFAAGFAATLSYHRLAQDNELTAVYAGGISHRAMLLPAMISGLLLSGVLLVLADQAMPRLLRSMDELITRDFTRMLQSSVERGQALIQPGGQRVLYADRFVPGEPEPGSSAIHKFDLLGVVVVQREPGSGLTWEASASRATVWVYRGGGGASSGKGDVGAGVAGISSSEGAGAPGAENAGPGSMTVVMRLLDSVGKSAGRATGQAGESTMSFVVPSIFRDDPKFLTFTEMLLAQDDPRRLGDVMAQHRATASILNERSVADGLRAVLERDKRTTLTDLSGRTVVVKATGLDLAPVENAQGLAAGAFALRSSSGPIEVTTVLEDGRARVQRARRAWISVPPAPEFQASLLTIRMSEVSTSGVAPDGEGTEQAGGVIREYQIPNLRLPEDRLAPLLKLDSKALI
ncbi:MAG: LptF/LptG family permease, partial [Phycisphaerales bacterium]|nr:LptF/LptG family permease [Phycisphaerales bacterium]